MSTWGTRRQLSFVLIFILILCILTVFLIFANRHVPSCTDKVQNQEELDVDCGGPCVNVCQSEISSITTLWTRVFKVREGVYDVAAYIENPSSFGLVQAPYHIKIYDADNVPVKDIEGSVYLNPNERVLIFEPEVNVGFRVPNRAFLTFEEDLDWLRLDIPRAPILTITNQKIEDSPVFTLRANVTNNSFFQVDGIELNALLYGNDGNVIGISRTFINYLGNDETKEVSFTWPGMLSEEVVSADIFPRTDMVTANILK